MAEHISQLVQKFVLDIQPANGILGRNLDFEPVHFVYNLGYLFLISFIWIGLMKIRIKEMRVIFSLITFVLIFQSWHFVEHSVKLLQHYTEGCVSCQGILGRFTNVMILHFIYNLIAFVPLILSYILIQNNMETINREIEIYKKLRAQ
jgi:hypothetical protein